MINFRVDQKIALVTGCSRGIGMAVAIELANAGADIIGVSNSLSKEGSEVGKAVEKTGRKFTLGDSVRFKVVSADMEKRVLNYKLLD